MKKQTKICGKCKKRKALKHFYTQPDRAFGQSYCKECKNQYDAERGIFSKLRMIQYKGNKCEKCGLTLKNSHYAVFEFHHKNPTTKTLPLGRMRTHSWAKILLELDKCIMLCANCHRVEEYS